MHISFSFFLYFSFFFHFSLFSFFPLLFFFPFFLSFSLFANIYIFTFFLIFHCIYFAEDPSNSIGYEKYIRTNCILQISAAITIITQITKVNVNKNKYKTNHKLYLDYNIQTYCPSMSPSIRYPVPFGVCELSQEEQSFVCLRL